MGFYPQPIDVGQVVYWIFEWWRRAGQGCHSTCFILWRCRGLKPRLADVERSRWRFSLGLHIPFIPTKSPPM